MNIAKNMEYIFVAAVIAICSLAYVADHSNQANSNVATQIQQN